MQKPTVIMHTHIKIAIQVHQNRGEKTTLNLDITQLSYIEYSIGLECCRKNYLPGSRLLVGVNTITNELQIDEEGDNFNFG